MTEEEKKDALRVIDIALKDITSAMPPDSIKVIVEKLDDNHLDILLEKVEQDQNYLMILIVAHTKFERYLTRNIPNFDPILARLRTSGMWQRNTNQ